MTTPKYGREDFLQHANDLAVAAVIAIGRSLRDGASWTLNDGYDFVRKISYVLGSIERGLNNSCGRNTERLWAAVDRDGNLMGGSIARSVDVAMARAVGYTPSEPGVTRTSSEFKRLGYSLVNVRVEIVPDGVPRRVDTVDAVTKDALCQSQEQRPEYLERMILPTTDPDRALADAMSTVANMLYARADERAGTPKAAASAS